MTVIEIIHWAMGLWAVHWSAMLRIVGRRVIQNDLDYELSRMVSKVELDSRHDVITGINLIVPAMRNLGVHVISGAAVNPFTEERYGITITISELE